jgi:hypothetical protein
MRKLKHHAFPIAENLNPSNLSNLSNPSVVTGRARMLAAMSLLLWVGAITAGRLMAYTAALR